MSDIAQAIAAAVREAIAAELPRALAEWRSGEAKPEARRVVTVPEACRRYGIGRAALIDLIDKGRLPASPRKMRGGRDGYMLRVSDCDRVLAGLGMPPAAT
ncbi:helix-turn-helix domain-containing protein [Methylibium sp.]|uniref:helix-turn-helix domain-containing protein n=1 Tax=Methylibium sp. TaxID=2067992 RepID=UPI00179BD93D|nr:helix-turn-helix domain-containing protein [Methylibium sp.]MBA3590300.1 helix-turn-helix domain-containing protein [Methylibium sp.]